MVDLQVICLMDMVDHEIGKTMQEHSLLHAKYCHFQIINSDVIEYNYILHSLSVIWCIIRIMLA